MRGSIQFELPSSLSDLLLPFVTGSAGNYLVSIGFPIPSFVSNFFRYPAPPEPKLVTDARTLIEAGHFTLCKEGVGGVYFIQNTDGSPMAIFKPQDEEPGALNNPKNIVQNPLLPPGGGSIREVAAYLLDKNNFARVPETYFLNGVTHTSFNSKEEKSGSLQQFIQNDGVSSNMGYSNFNTEDIHRIGILDIRIFNLDRNGENILIRNEEGHQRLIPIDHTYSLPPINSLDGAYFEWHYWPQAKKPFSQEIVDYVNSLDLESDAQLLRNLGFPEESVTTLYVTTTLLKEAVANGLTLFDMACLMSRGIPLTKPSRLEEIILASSTGLETNSRDKSSFLEVFRTQLREIFKQRSFRT